jgi:hypothetical protein
MLTLEAWMLKMEPWKFCRPVVSDLNHFDEEQDPDPHWSEKLDPDPDRIKGMRIRNPGFRVSDPDPH